MKQPSAFSLFLKNLTESGHLPGDSEDEKLRKSSLIVMSLPFAAAGLIWGSLYSFNGMVLPGMIPFNYGILSLLSFAYLRKSKRYKFYRTSQIFLILILPFLLQLSLGGFIPSSAVIIWAVISPLSAMVFYNTKHSLAWFMAYLMLVIVAYVFNDSLKTYFDWGLTDDFINLIFLMNIIAVSALIYAIQYYFVGNQANLKKAIEEQAEKLTELDELKSKFFANISHEFRTPLTLILGLVNKQIANADKPVDPKDSETIRRNSNRLLQLINQLLDLSKLEAGEVRLKASKGDITLFVRRMTMLFESAAKEKGIVIEFNGRSIQEEHVPQPLILYFDEEKLQKVITNLLSNAVKFVPDNGRIAVTITQENGQAQVQVSNTGEGIPEDVLPIVFDRFYQVDAGSTREHEGTGIGLALVKELIELHQGSVTVKSDSKLTVFTISLPIDDAYLQLDERVDQPVLQIKEMDIPTAITSRDSAQTERPKNYTKQSITGEKEDGPLEVLVVEDNPDLRGYIITILEEHYKVIGAVDGQDGLEKAETNIPDLIVSDVMMPRMDGYELCKQLKTKTNTNHIPVVLLTAKASQENKLEGLETGADAYLVKPFDKEELMVRIRNLIKIREQLQQKYQNGAWTKADKTPLSSVHEKFIEQIREAIEKEIDNHAFSVEDLGSAMAMSRSQIHRKLKALTDQSATQFIRNYRLYRAADLLKKQTGSVTEIAYQVGFSSQTYFSSSFQELFKCSPSEYVKS